MQPIRRSTPTGHLKNITFGDEYVAEVGGRFGKSPFVFIMQNQEEIWKDVVGYEGLYQVSNLGRVKSLPKYHFNRTIILKKWIDKKGYEHISLSKNNNIKHKSVHRLIAETFIPNPENKLEVDHINGIPSDNRVVNLRWCTRKENCNFPLYREHSSKERCWMYNRKLDLHPRARKVGQYSIGGELIRIWCCCKDACDTLGLSRGAVSQCCNGKRKTHKGFIWKFID